jgi:hypothetical protein
MENSNSGPCKPERYVLKEKKLTKNECNNMTDLSAKNVTVCGVEALLICWFNEIRVLVLPTG